MSFTLRAEQRIKRELRRLATRQLERASSDLHAQPDPAAIHDARKRVKKTRAILRLLEDEPRSGRRDKDEKRLRQAGRALSTLRDADVVLQTFDGLRQRHPRLPEQTAACVRRRLVDITRSAAAPLRRERLLTLATDDVHRVQRSSRRWHLPSLGPGDLAPLLGRAYRAGRDAMRDAVATPTSSVVHRWRRRSKSLWYQMRLLETVVPAVRTLVAELKRLDTLLGDDHNLHVLKMRLHADVSLRRLTRGVDEVVVAATAEQRDLRRRAFALGRRLYGERPKRFEQWIREHLTKRAPRTIARIVRRSAAA